MTKSIEFMFGNIAYIIVTSFAVGPFVPWIISNDTRWFWANVFLPSVRISEKCTNTSEPPPSGLMNPNPLASLNQLTVPVAAKQIDKMASKWIKRTKKRIDISAYGDFKFTG